MKKFLVGFFAITLLVSGCKSYKQDYETSQVKITTLEKQVSQSDSIVNELFASLGEVEANLAEITSREKIISQNSENKEISQDVRMTINNDIQAINDLLARNKKSIASLQKKLKDSRFESEQLKNFVASLEQRIVEKDGEIEQLKGELQKLNFKVEELNLTVSTLTAEGQSKQQVIEQKTEELNTAYYVVGTERELRDQKIIDKSGGFLGIGRSSNITKDFDKEKFFRIDVTLTDSIPFSATKVKLLTSHPSGSYTLIQENKKYKALKINNPKTFWQNSKVLVIVKD